MRLPPSRAGVFADDDDDEEGDIDDAKYRDAVGRGELVDSAMEGRVLGGDKGKGAVAAAAGGSRRSQQPSVAVIREELDEDDEDDNDLGVAHPSRGRRI